jgi:hypothetical protein
VLRAGDLVPIGIVKEIQDRADDDEHEIHEAPE